MKLVKQNKDIYDTLSLIYEAEITKPMYKEVVSQSKLEKVEKVILMPTKDYLVQKTGRADRTINERLQALLSYGFIVISESIRVRKATKFVYKLTPTGKEWLKANKAIYEK